MGAGKSTVGAELARRLGWKFKDLDDLVEAENQSTVGEIFRQKGELAFRNMEARALQSLLSSTSAERTPLVLALGGGAFAQRSIREALDLRKAKVVFLSAASGELWRRCTLDDKARPLRQDEGRFNQLLAERLPWYRQALLTVETTNKSIPDIAAEIESSLALVSG